MSIQWISPARLALLNVVLDVDPELRGRVFRAFDKLGEELQRAAMDLKGDAAAEVHFLFEKGALTVRDSVEVEETLESRRDDLPMHFGTGARRAPQSGVEPSKEVVDTASIIFDTLRQNGRKLSPITIRTTLGIKPGRVFNSALALLLKESPNSIKASGQGQSRLYWHVKS